MVNCFTFACSDAMALSSEVRPAAIAAREATPVPVPACALVLVECGAPYSQRITRVRSFVGLCKTRTLQKVRNEQRRSTYLAYA